jgi:hypothetical protein
VSTRDVLCVVVLLLLLLVVFHIDGGDFMSPFCVWLKSGEVGEELYPTSFGRFVIRPL